MARTIPVSTFQARKLVELASKHPDLTYAVTSDGLVLARWLTAWIRDGYRAQIGGELHDIVARPDTEPITYVIPQHGRIVGYCKEKPGTEREASLVGSLAEPLPKAAKRLSFKAYDRDAADRLYVAARKRESAAVAA